YIGSEDFAGQLDALQISVKVFAYLNFDGFETESFVEPQHRGEGSFVAKRNHCTVSDTIAVFGQDLGDRVGQSDILATTGGIEKRQLECTPGSTFQFSIQ